MTRSSVNLNGSSNLEMAQSNQELIIEKGIGNKRKILIGACLVILIIVALVVAITLFSGGRPISEALRSEGPTSLSLEDLLHGRYNADGFNATWVSGNQLLYKDDDGNIVLYNVDTATIELLLPENASVVSKAFEFSLSADKRYLLLAHNHQKLFRYSYVAQYTIVDLSGRGTNQLKAFGESVLQLAVWAPVGNGIVFVAKNDIFYRPNATSSTVRQITRDGVIGNVYNGVPDWVYEEEVLNSNKALWISPDGKKLAYAKYTDTYVPTMTLPVYGQPGSMEFQYTKAVQIRYPKPGARNPFVTCNVADLTSDADTSLALEPPASLQKDAILGAVSWASNNSVGVIWMNRVQNQAAIVSYDTTEPPTAHVEILLPQEDREETFKKTGHIAAVYQLSPALKIFGYKLFLVLFQVKFVNETRGWIELLTPPIFSKDGEKLLLIMSHSQGATAESYRHVTLFAKQANAIPQPLTSGRFVVTEILGWDERKELVYYHATTEEDPGVHHVYSVSTSTQRVRCLSCDVRRSVSYTPCLYNTAEFSTDFSHYALTCDGPDIPEVSLYKSNGRRLVTWENNDQIQANIDGIALPITKRLTYKVADGFTAHAMLLLPPNMDTSGDTKYPMIVDVYGGPDSYQVVEKFNLQWGSYLAANKSIIYAKIDGRGSGLKGDKMLFSIYRRMGTVEVEDQINVTRQIQNTLKYVDASRTAIWGWSYGGFAAGMALATDRENIFKCGISVAPVTDWTLYDSIYTERYMGLPAPNDNIEGYRNAQLLDKYEGMRDKQYFLVHGTLDDNVHYQQSMLWAKVLEHRDILFDQLSYPDEDHGLASVRPHLYHSLERFIDGCFIEDE